jgi:Putative Flp pilus-assembly TadE/G-like
LPGQMMLLVTVALIVLLGLAGLATDFGLLWTEKRQIQTAADAAAVAGALAVVSGGNVTTAAKTDSSVNGFTDGSNSVTVTVNNPPASGSYAGDSSAVEAIVTKPERTYFLRVLGYNSVAITGRAVAHTGAHDCIYVMDPSANNALVVSGSASLSSGCGIIVNSSSSQAMVSSGSACISASAIGVNGNYSSGSCAPVPTPKTGVPAALDPLAYLTEPTPGTCTPSTASGHGYTATNGATISHGTYCSGITVPGGVTLNLNSGLYILDGGGLTVSGTSSIIGTGVTFYNTQGAASYKPIVISGGSSSSLTAPTSGTYEGILFFEDRSITSTQQNTISGGSTGAFQGALYFLHSPLVYSGGSIGSSTAYTVIVADTLTISGSSTVNDDYSSLASGGSPARETAALGE